MTSIYQRALGAEFERLHAMIQQRFGFSSESGIASIGTGVMDTLWHGRLFTLPFLYLGAWHRIMFPERGRRVPFTIKNYAYLDPHGRETVSWVRTFATHRPRRFDAYMIYSERRGCIVDYLGTHQHLAVDLELSIDDRGGMRIRSGAQRFYEGPVAFTFPTVLSGDATVCEWYDDRTARFCIDVRVANKRWGPLFGYNGTFTVEWRRVASGATPGAILPRRYERRE